MISKPENRIVDAVVQALETCNSILFITGAGISADSGIPTYRGIGGLYNVDTTEDGCSIEEALSATMLERNPNLTWKYLAQIGRAVLGAQPNRAHEVIAEMESHFDRVWTLTQNVDGFHRLAGTKQLIEAHGNMYSLSCTECPYSNQLHELSEIEIPPKCPRCSALMRPDVVLFGEFLSGVEMERMLAEMQKGFDMVFSIGTSSLFPYIQLPLKMAKAKGKTTVEINPCETSVSHLVDYRIATGAAEALDEIWKRFRRL